MKSYRERRLNIPPRGAHCNRRGIAPLEVVMFLPTLGFMLLLIFLTAGVGMSMISVAGSARYRVWEGLDTPWDLSATESLTETALFVEGDPTYRHIEKLEKPPNRFFEESKVLPDDWDASRGLLGSTAEESIPFVPRFLQDRFTTAEAECHAFGGCWDHREMPFADAFSSKRHRSLAFPKYFDYYEGPDLTLDGFQSLTDF